MQTGIGISPENLAKTAQELCILLSDEYVLYTKTRHAHWNVEGSDFYEKHKFFESQYEALDEMIDTIAERIRSLGHYAPAALKTFLELTHLTEMNREKNDGAGFVKALLTDHESIIIRMREKINLVTNDYHDAGTGDFITGLMETHEKMAWMLRVQLR
ncbi:MAG: Dps family protein [Chitinophagaceae bacterium]